MRIKISTTLRLPINRQIPFAWQNQGIEVLINEPVERCDAWVVYQGLHRPETTIVPPERVFFFCYEPLGLHTYQPRFLEQFARVVTSQRSIRHPGVIFRHQAQPWEAGIERIAAEQRYQVNVRYEDFAAMSKPEKPRRLSAICSRKTMVPGHKARQDFVAALQQVMEKDLAVFGHGFNPIPDKWDALASYAYHLVLENSCVPDYWTEKLADAYLAWCMPLVWGCPNLGDYFPADSFVALDPNDVAGSLKLVQETISRPPTERQLAAVAEARQLVLEEYNLFSEIRRMIETTPATAPQKIRLRDERLFLPGGTWRPFIRALTDPWRVK